eukprot:4715000-Amphidinium_carterae.4
MQQWPSEQHLPCLDEARVALLNVEHHCVFLLTSSEQHFNFQTYTSATSVVKVYDPCKVQHPFALLHQHCWKTVEGH